MSLVRWKFYMQLLITRKYFKFIEKNEIDLIYVDLCTYFPPVWHRFTRNLNSQTKKRRTQSTKNARTYLVFIECYSKPQHKWIERKETKERKKAFLNKSEIVSFWLGYTTLSPRNTMMNATKSFNIRYWYSLNGA